MNRRLTASRIRLFSTLAAITLALPLGWGEFTGLFAWFSPFVMLNSVFVLKSFVLLNLLGLAVLVLSFFRKRWFCRYMCPAGYLCDLASGYNIRSSFRLNKVPFIGRWTALISLAAAIVGLPMFILFDPMAIFNGFFSLSTGPISAAVIISFMGLPLLLIMSWFFPGIWCVKLCPLGGLQDEIAGLRKRLVNQRPGSKNRIPDKYQGRRAFIAAGTGLLLGLIVPRFLKSNSKSYFRPPSSLPENLFNTLCIRCGSCIKACPSKIIVHRQDPDDPVSWMTPEVTFNEGYCIEDCNLCSIVCPSGAITQFKREAKKHIFMATAEVHLDKCLLMERVECDRCKISCGYDAITIEFNRDNMMSFPLIDSDKCVGCGACAVICPPRTIEMIPV